MNRPQFDEHPPFYATYINKIGDGDIIAILTRQQENTWHFLKSIPEDDGSYAYAEGKWTIKQVVGHMIDTERIMAYRALRFARNDASELNGFDQDAYVANARFNSFLLDDLTDEFMLLRKTNLYFFKTLNAEEKGRSGIANGNLVTVNALLYIIAGHELHHVNVLKDKYILGV